MRLARFPLALAFALVVHASLQAQVMYSCSIAGGDRAFDAAAAPATKTSGAGITEPTTTEPEPARAPESVPAHAPATPPAPVPTPLQKISRGESYAYADAYSGAYRILHEENECSRFFGGPSAATEVLNRFVESLQSAPLESRSVAIRMSGAVRYVRNARTGTTYRLFGAAAVNSNGPLARFDSAAASRMSVGSFRADTKGARVLILLHELGHLLPGTEGEWLLPNDGGDGALSTRNTATVESHCRRQLEGVRD